MIAKFQIYTSFFDQNGQYNAWNWTPWQKQEAALLGKGKVEVTSDTSRLTQVTEVDNDNQIRTLQYQQDPGRGYI